MHETVYSVNSVNQVDYSSFFPLGSHQVNFKNMGDTPLYSGGGCGGRLAGNNFSLTRQPSIYSLTFDEFQNSMGGLRKDFGSMNMDEFLKNIWTAEETQALASSSSSFGAAAAAAEDGGLAARNLQRQGSLTLPRTLSQKTVDEVWKEIYKENGSVGKDGNGSNLQPRQQTLGEMTLEEFLVRAGVVREDAQLLTAGKSDNNNTTSTNNNNNNTRNNGFYGELLRSNDTTGLALGFGQQGRTNEAVAANQVMDISSNASVSNQSPNLAINMNGDRASQRQQQLFPKQPAVNYASPIHLANKGFALGGRLGDGGIGIVGAGAGTFTVAAASTLNQLSSDGAGKSSGDTASLSPVSYMFNGGLSRKRGSGAVEKVVERRQRRMIKNRESAARSRARKQAYTMELEAEVAKLKEENQEFRNKQAEIMEMQKNQILETMIQEKEAKKRGLRRTQTGPW